MGFFDSLLGLSTNKNTLNASRDSNSEIWQGTDLNNRLISDAAQYAKGDVISGTGAAKGDVTGYSGQAQGALGTGVNNAVSTVQGSNGMFQPFAANGTAANGMRGNALGLNGPAGNAAATAAFQTSPGYQYSVDQATDAAARKAASLGMAGSGNTLQAITGLASNLADQQYGSFLDRLQGLGSQGLSAAGAISGNNALAGGYQYGGGGALASLLNGTGTTLGTLDNGLGTNLGNIETNRANQSVSNIQNGLRMVTGNTMGAAQSQDRADSSNNGIFSKLLLGGAGPDGGSGMFGNLARGFKL